MTNLSLGFSCLAFILLFFPPPAKGCARLNPCDEVRPEPLQLAGIVETKIPPIDTMLSQPLYVLWNYFLKTICFGKYAGKVKSQLAFSEIQQTQNENKDEVIIIGGRGKQITIVKNRETANIQTPVLLTKE